MRRAHRLWQDVVASLLLAAASVFAQPAHAAPLPAETEVWNYRVSVGDTLIAICAQFLERPEDWLRVQKLNGVSNERRLLPDTVLRIPLTWMRQTATVADVVFVNGQATVRSVDAAGARTSRTLAIGDTVRAHDTIRTAVGASVSLRLSDKSRVMITPGSEVRIVHLLQLGRDAIPKVDLQIESGGAEIEVAPAPPGRSFEIRTPAVNLGVRGTDFRARFEPGAQIARVEVREGRVGASADRQQLAIPAGFGTRAEAGKPVEPPRELIAAPDVSPVARRLDRVPLRFAWSPVAGATAYRAQVLARGEPVRLLLDGEFVEPAARWSDLPDGNYRLRVRAIDSRGNEGHDGSADFVLKARPEAPFISAPADGSRAHGERVQFEWARVADAKRYRLQISSRADFSEPLFDDAGIDSNTRVVTLAPGSYHWRVASIARGADGADDQGPFGDANAFALRAIPASPTLEAPETGAEGLLLRWQQPGEGQQMQFQVASDADFSRILVDQTTRSNSGRLPRPAPGRYYMRARTIDQDGFEGPFGAVQLIDIPQPPPPKWLWLLPLGLLLLL